jgi:hypothetical protein
LFPIVENLVSKMKSPPSLYDICVKAAVKDCVTVCKFCKKEFRSLPDNVLFDFYYTVSIALDQNPDNNRIASDVPRETVVPSCCRIQRTGSFHSNVDHKT